MEGRAGVHAIRLEEVKTLGRLIISLADFGPEPPGPGADGIGFEQLKAPVFL